MSFSETASAFWNRLSTFVGMNPKTSIIVAVAAIAFIAWVAIAH